MRRHVLDLCLLGALLAALALAGCGEDDASPAPGASDAAAAIDEFVARTLPPEAGGTLVAVRDREIVTCRGFGFADREAGVEAGCDTVYDVMSMTKQFTAAAILKLDMLGELEVTERIGAYFAPVPKDKREITIHHLLTHTSGLVEALGDDYDRQPRESVVADALRSELRSPPGAEYHYSNAGYSLLAAIVAEVSGQGYEEFLDEHLFAPAGMTQTGYVLPDWQPDRVAVEYDADGEPQGTPFDHPWASDGPYWNLRGNGGMLSTARDMYRWEVALEGEDVLDERAKEKLFTPYVREEPGGDTHYGYGWVITRAPGLGRVAWHDGGNGWSFGLVTRLLDEDLMVFWITNRYRDAAANWNLARLGEQLTTGVAERLRAGG